MNPVDTFIARQPIFDRDLSVYGYEVLFRSGSENVFKSEDADRASAQVVESTMHTFGVASLTQGRKTFVNMTPTLIIQGTAALLPKENTVIEVQSEVTMDPGLLKACEELKKAGFMLAIDNYQGGAAVQPLVALADVLKVDFQAVDGDGRRAFAGRHAGRLKLLAQKVEGRNEYSEAVEQGYSLFQGFFFAKPEMITRRDLPAYKLNYLQILQEVNRPEVDFDGLQRIVRQDVALSVKLLRYINSAVFGLKGKVDDLKKALMMLGLQLLKKWVSLLSIAAMGDDKPQELVVTSLARARFCEEFGKEAGLKESGFDLFMTGMLSCLDALLDRPMSELVKDLPVADKVKQAVQGDPSGPGKILRLIHAYERADWNKLVNFVDGYSIEMKRIPEIYRESIGWAHQIFTVKS